MATAAEVSVACMIVLTTRRTVDIRPIDINKDPCGDRGGCKTEMLTKWGMFQQPTCPVKGNVSTRYFLIA
jgi:hypothetical protein